MGLWPVVHDESVPKILKWGSRASFCGLTPPPLWTLVILAQCAGMYMKGATVSSLLIPRAAL